VNERLVFREIVRTQDAIRAVEKRLRPALARLPRRSEFDVTNLSAGATTTVDVTWTVPIPGDYAVVVAPTTAATFVGLVLGSVQAGSKTPTGCTVIVANRHASQTIAAATFDVLIFPI
jgi:hypothetical protein